MRSLRTFGRDQHGIAAVEFAMIAPFMLLFYFGLTELCQAMLTERRVNHVSAAVGDLITQKETTSVAELDDVFEIGSIVLAPFPKATLTVVTTHVTADDEGAPVVNWSRGYSGGSPKSTIALPPGLTLNPNDSLVVTEATYEYESPFGYFVPNGITFNEKSYLRPRRSAQVVCADCPPLTPP